MLVRPPAPRLRPRALCAAACLALAIHAHAGGLAHVAAQDAATPSPAPAVPVSAQAADAPAQVAKDGEPGREVRAEYQSVVERAVSEFDAGRFAEARALFLRAHELWPSARTFRTLGMTAFELRMYPQALLELQAALDDTRRALSAEQRQQTEALVRETHVFVGRYRLHLSPPQAELWIDDTLVRRAAESVLILAVGAHQLRARAPGHAELRRPLQVQGREDEALTITLEPDALSSAQRGSEGSKPASETARAAPARSSLRRNFAYASFAVGVAGVVSGAVLGGLAIQRKQTVKDNCPGGDCYEPYHDDLDQLTRFGNASTATLVLGGAGLAAAAILWFSGRSAPSVEARASAREQDKSRSALLGLRLRISPQGIAGRF